MEIEQIAILILMLILSSCHPKINSAAIKSESMNNSQVQVLLVGTSHWRLFNQRGGDYAKFNEIDILSTNYQNQVEEISNQIAAFSPDKIFVEKNVTGQVAIDSLYQLYKTTNWGDTLRDETYQLGFRTANKLKLDKVYCVANYHYEFPMDSVTRTALENNQNHLVEELDETIAEMTEDYKNLLLKEPKLSEVILHWNTEFEYKRNIGWYVNSINKIGNDNDFAGSWLAANMYRNNLNILSLIQRKVEKQDKKIMVLMGSAHTAMLKDLIRYIPDWEIVDLNTVIK